ncbi:MAG: hypothetical protein ABIK89_03335 [Planctomycetota bacterium]
MLHGQVGSPAFDDPADIGRVDPAEITVSLCAECRPAKHDAVPAVAT